MAGGAEHNRALSYCCRPDPSARSGTDELVTAVFTASEHKLDVHRKGQRDGDIFPSEKGMVLVERGMGSVHAPSSGSSIAGRAANGGTAVGAELQFYVQPVGKVPHVKVEAVQMMPACDRCDLADDALYSTC
jgi:hypothetical protein